VSESGGPGDDPVGSMSEEALKLLGALSGWAREHGSDLGAGLGAGLEGLDEHLATGAPECSWCPICRAVHAVRQTSPEVRAHLAVAASSLLQAAAGLLATAVPDDARERAAGVEHIDLEDDADDETHGAWPGEDDA